MYKSSMFVLAFVAVSAIAVSGEISPGYLEIESFLQGHFKDNPLRVDKETKYRVVSMSAPEEMKKTTRDWNNFAKLNPFICETDAIDVLRKVMSDSGAIEFVSGAQEPEHQIQTVIIGIAKLFAERCPDRFEEHSAFMGKLIPMRNVVGFVESLNEAAHSVCDKTNKLAGAELAPSNPASAQFYGCVRSGPTVFVEGIKNYLSKQWATEVSRGAKEVPAKIEGERAQGIVLAHLDNCKYFSNYNANFYDNVEFISQVTAHQYRPKFYQDWASNVICTEFLARGDNTDVAAALEGYTPEAAKQGKASSFFGRSH